MTIRTMLVMMVVVSCAAACGPRECTCESTSAPDADGRAVAAVGAAAPEDAPLDLTEANGTPPLPPAAPSGTPRAEPELTHEVVLERHLKRLAQGGRR